MKINKAFPVCALVLVFAAKAVAQEAADPALGFWLAVDEKTGKVTSGWEMYTDRNGSLCGRILSMSDYPLDTLADHCKKSYKDFPVPGDVSRMTVVNTPWLFGLKRDGPGKWSGGKIINPEDGSIWQAKVTFHAADGKHYTVDTLEMRGELALGIGRSQFWRKAERAEAAGLRPAQK